MLSRARDVTLTAMKSLRLLKMLSHLTNPAFSQISHSFHGSIAFCIHECDCRDTIPVIGSTWSLLSFLLSLSCALVPNLQSAFDNCTTSSLFLLYSL